MFLQHFSDVEQLLPFEPHQRWTHGIKYPQDCGSALPVAPFSADLACSVALFEEWGIIPVVGLIEAIENGFYTSLG